MGIQLNIGDHEAMRDARNKGRKKKSLLDHELIDLFLKKCPLQIQSTIERSNEKTSNRSISTNSLSCLHPVGCGERFIILDHTLYCKTLVTRRHNEVRDFFGEFCQKTWGNCVK